MLLNNTFKSTTKFSERAFKTHKLVISLHLKEVKFSFELNKLFFRIDRLANLERVLS